MEKKVTTIPATLNRFTSAPVVAATKRKVAGYARVSTDLEEQQSSYEAQMDYYKNYITSRSDWEFVDMYSDEGITATSTKFRAGFKRMVEDALAGKIDLIITKSISRFARNTVDSLTTIRQLKENGVEVYFEKENIWTFDAKGELLITIMSSLAQEESRSISENTAWGKRKAFADGKVSVAFSHFLGYDKGFVINEEEAVTVRMIYKYFLMGYSMSAIKKELEKRERLTATGNKHWTVSAIESVLTNEKYRGDALLQKTFTTDFLTKAKKKNEGELAQYHIAGHHEPIVDPAIYDAVQVELRKRAKAGRYLCGKNAYAAKIRCGDCGSWYTPVTWHSTDKYRRIVYRCVHKYDGKGKCNTPHLYEAEIQKFFISAVNQLLDVKKETIENLEMLLETATSTAALEDELKRVSAMKDESEERLTALIEGNARKPLNQEEYNKQYTENYERYEQMTTRVGEIEEEIMMRNAQALRIRNFIDRFSELDGVQTIFDEQLWAGIVETMTVYKGKKVVITFVGGIEVPFN